MGEKTQNATKPQPLTLSLRSRKDRTSLLGLSV